jgi:ADP-heptose:LPS heptosyltransferase
VTTDVRIARVLVVRLGALGDLVLLRGVLASLRAVGASVTLVAPARSGSAVVSSEDPALAQRLVPWESAELARALAAESDDDLRRLVGHFDAVLCYSRNADLSRRLSGLTRRLIAHDPAPAAGHAAAWLARPLVELGIPIVQPPVVAPATEEGRAIAVLREQLPARFLALHPGSGSAAKNWPIDRYAALARIVSDGRPWLLSLGPADDALEPLADATNVLVTRHLPPRNLAALLASAGVYVGNDSGVTHLAAALGIPTVALFGPTDPEVWSPLGPRVRTLRAPEGKMASLSVDDVARSIAIVLS